jgi:RNA polymerase sigma-54 factor
MAMTPKLAMRQGQALVMTPQLQQAIKLLQMSNFDLQAFVDAELERNPLIERAEDTAAPRQATGAGETVAGAGEGEASGEAGGEDRAAFRDSAIAAPVPGSPDSGWTAHGAGTGGSFNPAGGWDSQANLACETTLHEHLTEQLNLTISNPADRLIGAYLVGMVDDRGYLTGDVDSVAELLGAAKADVERVLAIVQDFDPPGIMARNLKECLVLQLKDRRRYDPVMARFIDNLELVARRDYPGLQKVCGVDREDIRGMVQEVRSLNPKPGNAFGSVVIQPIVPDVTVKPAPDGAWLVELNSEILPRVLVSRQYYAKVIRGAGPETDKTYLSNCLSNATWLVKSLDQRATTILKVAREIVRQQDGFLVAGVEALRPLNLRTVADAISMHESTVSRVTANKYMATPRGTFGFKYFFTTAIAAAHGEPAHSAESVRHKIREMIDGEAAEKVLSDDAIVASLNEAGIDIARRTVAKYREAMRIASSVQRRRDKRMDA